MLRDNASKGELELNELRLLINRYMLFLLLIASFFSIFNIFSSISIAYRSYILLNFSLILSLSI